MSHRYFEKEDHVQLYSKYRVKTSSELHQHVISYLKEKYTGALNVAVDVGCGSGQNTFGYSQYFDKVVGADVSPNQIAVANEQKRDEQTGHANVEFRVSPAEKLDFLEDNSVQLVTVNTALHWFDIPTFFNEVLRVLSPNGVLAISATKLPVILSWEKNPSKTEELTRILRNESTENLIELKAVSENQTAWDMLKGKIIPENFVDFQRTEDQFFVEHRRSLDHLMEKKMSYTKYQKFRDDNGDEAALKLLTELKERLRQAVSDELNASEKSDEIHFIEKTFFFVLLCRKPPNYQLCK